MSLHVGSVFIGIRAASPSLHAVVFTTKYMLLWLSTSAHARSESEALRVVYMVPES